MTTGKIEDIFLAYANSLPGKQAHEELERREALDLREAMRTW